MRLFGLVCVIAASGLGASSAQTVDLRPGRYEATLEMVMMGEKMPPEKEVQCITREDLKDLTKMMSFSLGDEFDKMCKVSDYKGTGTKVTYTSICGEGADRLTTSVDLTFTPESFVGVMKSTGKGKTVVSSRMSAKRIGDCAKAP